MAKPSWLAHSLFREMDDLIESPTDCHILDSNIVTVDAHLGSDNCH
jgi:hypothetical protein